jgi:Tfp pilus assembly protein PilN
MINLLDTDTLRHYRAARVNVLLRKYVVLLILTLVAVLLAFAGGIFITLGERSAAEAEIASHQQALTQYADVKKEAESFTANLKIAKSILSQEVLYSDMIVQIARTLPSGAILSSLSLDQETLTKPIVLAGRVRTKDEAVTLKNTLESSPLFESVNLNSINEQAVQKTSPEIVKKFPVVVTLSMNATKGKPGSLLP